MVLAVVGELVVLFDCGFRLYLFGWLFWFGLFVLLCLFCWSALGFDCGSLSVWFYYVGF